MTLSKDQVQTAFDVATAPAREERLRQAAIREERKASRQKSPVDFVALAIASLLTLALAFFVAWWYSLDRDFILNHLGFFIGMFAAAAGAPMYCIVCCIRRRSNRQDT